MHNGSEPNLQEIVNFYDNGGREQRTSLAPEIHPLHLTAGEKASLVEFLNTLTGSGKPIVVPALPR